MKCKFVVKLEENPSCNRFLVKNAEERNSTPAFAFRLIQFKHEIAYFNSKEEAISACEEALQHEGTQGLPIFLEAII